MRYIILAAIVAGCSPAPAQSFTREYFVSTRGVVAVQKLTPANSVSFKITSDTTLVQTWAGTYLVTSRGPLAVVTTKVGNLTHIFGSPKLSASAFVFGGLKVGPSSGVVGVAAGFDFRLADQLTLTLGPAGYLQASRKPVAGLYVGITARF